MRFLSLNSTEVCCETRRTPGVSSPISEEASRSFNPQACRWSLGLPRLFSESLSFPRFSSGGSDDCAYPTRSFVWLESRCKRRVFLCAHICCASSRFGLTVGILPFLLAGQAVGVGPLHCRSHSNRGCRNYHREEGSEDGYKRIRRSDRTSPLRHCDHIGSFGSVLGVTTSPAAKARGDPPTDRFRECFVFKN